MRRLMLVSGCIERLGRATQALQRTQAVELPAARCARLLPPKPAPFCGGAVLESVVSPPQASHFLMGVLSASIFCCRKSRLSRILHTTHGSMAITKSQPNLHAKLHASLGVMIATKYNLL